MIYLTSWEFSCKKQEANREKKFYMHGYVRNHPKDTIPDGMWVNTSRIINIELELEKNRLLVYTRSKHTYELLFAEICKENIATIQECFRHFKISEQSIKELKRRVEQLEAELLERVSAVINCQELFIQMGIEGAKKAFFKDCEGKISEVSITPHTGMFTDSVLIMDKNVHFSYYDRVYSIEPYQWSDNLVAVYIENVSTGNITFEQKSRRILCREITVIPKQE